MPALTLCESTGCPNVRSLAEELFAQLKRDIADLELQLKELP